MKRGFDIIPACAGIDIRSQNPEGILCDRMENRGLKPAILIVEQKKFFPSPLPLTWGMGYSELCPLSSDF
ncbi:hypothetical protein AVDCRST_MAG84-6465 [uncultured Microcoleus sp.]|uniref:Uncharacterized protein n=1 Tax=uncultured Microcoleus sp. TaxID=259945 RepID=A0A6J4PET2_9CYAN|nr:hypothetical protein AVDCRST_MAG84-6465 [uncultured Microcoleus sp.]